MKEAANSAALDQSGVQVKLREGEQAEQRQSFAGTPLSALGLSFSRRKEAKAENGPPSPSLAATWSARKRTSLEAPRVHSSRGPKAVHSLGTLLDAAALKHATDGDDDDDGGWRAGLKHKFDDISYSLKVHSGSGGARRAWGLNAFCMQHHATRWHRSTK